MSFNANNIPGGGGGGERKRAPAVAPGAYPARIVSLILLGKQVQEYKGEKKAPALRMRVTYELLDEFLKDDDGKDLLDKPRWVTQEFNFFSLKADKAVSTKLYYALDPKEEFGGDFAKLVGSPCIVTIANSVGKKNGVVYENVSAVSAMRDKEAAKAPPLVNEPYLFDPYSPDLVIWDRLPEWLQNIIKGAVDYTGGPLQKALEAAGKPSAASKAVNPDEVQEDEDEEADNSSIPDDDSGEDW